MSMNKYDLEINGINFFIYKDDKVWGDGTHETTKSMMSLLSKYEIKDKSVLEIGTGTGILSILCSKLGANKVLTFDMDPYAIEWARKNFKHNEVDVEIEINNLSDYYYGQPDIIIANLPTSEQIENVKTIHKNMSSDTLFFMTFWNKIKFEDYVKGFKIIEHIEGEEYDSYVLKLK